MTDTKRSPRPPRPFRPSRKKYQEVLRALKVAVSLKTLPWTQRLRAAELIIAVYGVAELAPVPPLTGHNRKVVKDLVEEAAFEGHVRKQVQAKMKAEIEAEELERLGTVHPAQLAALKYLSARGLPAEVEAESEAQNG